MSLTLYAGRSGLSVLLIEKEPMAGRLQSRMRLRIILDRCRKAGGASLIKRMSGAGGRTFGSVQVRDQIQSVDFNGEGASGVKKGYPGTICDHCLAGPMRIQSDVKGEDKYRGSGISYCATCDANFPRSWKYMWPEAESARWKKQFT